MCTQVAGELLVSGLDVHRHHGGEVFGRRLLAQAHDAQVPVGAGALDQGPGEPAVAEAVDASRLGGPAEDRLEKLHRGGVERVSRLLC